MRFHADLFIFFIVTLLAEVLGTIGGFGSSVFFVSFSQFLFDFKEVLALTGLLHIFSNSSKIFLFRKTIDWRLVVRVGISSVVLAVVGAYLSATMDFAYAKLVLGFFLTGFAVFFLIRPDFVLRQSVGNAVSGGAIAGFLAGLVGTGGAIRGLVLASFNLEKNLFVGTSAAIDMGVDLSRTAIYFFNDYTGDTRGFYSPLLMVASFFGSYLGKIILEKIPQEKFKTLVLVLILTMGLTIMAGWLRV